MWYCVEVLGNILLCVVEAYQFCVENGIEVLSPQNLHLKDMFNDNLRFFMANILLKNV